MSSKTEPEILLCDNHVLGLAKPVCMPTVPDESGDLSLLDWAREWVRQEFEKPGGVFLGVVHRLDRPVSGVVVFGRTSKGASRLSDAWRRGVVAKTYLGICEGELPGERGAWTQWLVKDRARNLVVVAEEGSKDAKEARTGWRVLKVAGGKTWVELKPETGRPHQLRVACASLGAPFVGDVKYGASSPLPNRSIRLHAASLAIPHPVKEEGLDLSCPAPFPGL